MDKFIESNWIAYRQKISIYIKSLKMIDNSIEGHFYILSK